MKDAKVEVNVTGRAVWYPQPKGWTKGIIKKVYGDGTFDVAYEDGTTGVKVEEASIRLADRSVVETPNPVNRAGVPMSLGYASCESNYYCGREVGEDALPNSDGRCGPNNGPQCPDCQGCTVNSLLSEDRSTIVHKMVVSDCEFGAYELGWTCNLCKLSTFKRNKPTNYRWLCLKVSL